MIRSLPLLLLLALPAPAQPTADLKFVPADATAFVHVRAAEVWKSDAMAEYRKIVGKAGARALAALDADFVPAPSTLDRVTTVVLPFEKAKPEPRFVTVLAFTAPFDATAVKATYMPKGKAQRSGTREYFTDPTDGLAVHFIDERTLAFGDAPSVAVILAMPAKADGPPAAALALAPKLPLVACANLAQVPTPPEMPDRMPADLRPLLKAKTVTVTVDSAKAFAVAAKVAFGSPAEAAAGEKAFRALAGMGRKHVEAYRGEAERMVFGRQREGDKPRNVDELPEAAAGVAALGGLNFLDEILADLPLKTDGDSVSASVTLPAYTAQVMNLAVLGAGAVLPAVQKLRSSAARMQATNNLKQIAIALHCYHDVHGKLPPAALADGTGKPLLSWRVAILPYIEQQHLYDKFKLDEPWDSKHNLDLVKNHPVKVYTDPRVPVNPDKPYLTHYKVFRGKGAGFEGDEGLRFAQFTDGLSNTAMVAAAGDGVPWSKPEDFAFDPDKKVPDLTKPFGALLLAMFDGSVRTLKPSAIENEEFMKAIITRAGGETIELGR